MSLDNIKITDRNKTKTQGQALVKSYGNDPYFIKKAKESKEFLDKHGFPKELILKR